jgi:hypothetical protein
MPFEMLTGAPRFSADSAVGPACRHVHDDPGPPSARRRGLPERLDLIMAVLLAKDPVGRPPSAQAATPGALGGTPWWATGPGLPGAAGEAAAVAALHQVTALTGVTAQVQAVTTALDGARLAHLAAHGHIHPDNPLFLAAGQPAAAALATAQRQLSGTHPAAMAAAAGFVSIGTATAPATS